MDRSLSRVAAAPGDGLLMRRVLGLMLIASATAGAQVAVGARTAEMPQPDFNGRPTSTYFTYVPGQK